MKISPSILACNFEKIEEEIKSISEASIIHLDVMDGIFVPNKTFDYHLINDIRNVSNQIFDTHLMIVDPIKYIKDYALAGSDYITFHYETGDITETINEIKKYGKKVGISIKPNTKPEVLIPYLKDIDLVLIMSVEPGFGGQKFMENSIDKAIFYFDYKYNNSLHYLISIDGGINEDTINQVKDYIDIAVMGTAVFKKSDRNSFIKEMEEK